MVELRAVDERPPHQFIERQVRQMLVGEQRPPAEHEVIRGIVRIPAQQAVGYRRAVVLFLEERPCPRLVAGYGRRPGQRLMDVVDGIDRDLGSIVQRHEQFWLALLTYPDDIQQRIRAWNGYLAWRLPDDFRHEIRNVGNPPFNQFAQGQPLQLTKDEKKMLDKLAEEYGGHPTFSDAPSTVPPPYMDFSDHIFHDEICFSGRVLVNANFTRARFRSLLKLGLRVKNGAEFFVTVYSSTLPMPMLFLGLQPTGDTCTAHVYA